MDTKEIADKSSQKIKVSCLPVAGHENPYQKLMMEGLRENSTLAVESGAGGKFFAVLRTWIKHRSTFIHFDWISRYFVRNPAWLSYLHGPLFLLEVFLVKHVLKSRLVWTLHNLSRHDTQVYGFEKWVERKFARNCSWIRVFDSSTALKAAKLFKIPKNAFHVVPEGSFVACYPNNIGYHEARHRLLIEKNKLVFLYLGNLRPYKGVDDLIEAFNQVKKGHWLLIIAGRPHHRKYSRSLLQKVDGNPQISMEPRFIGEHELQVYYNACDFVVYPFRRIENSGSVVMAMGFSKPIIAPYTGVLESRLQNQRNLLYKNHLSKALESAAALSVNERKEIGARNFSSLSQHTWHDFSKLFTRPNKKVE